MINSEIIQAQKALSDKKIILYPTDTLWGIGCDATDFKLVAKIYQIKKRSQSKSLIVLVSSINMLNKYVKVSKKIKEFLKKNTQKPTTFIYKNPKGFAKNAIAKDNTIAIRIVQDDFCRKLIKRFGKPIISTSANISGQKSPKSFSEIDTVILDSVDYVVNLYKNRIANKASTLLTIIEDDVVVLRA